ncbi:CGNR zinc finger domain-containing protein [Embleya sp. NBC_00896]|uniref:CGNR zinc finger domain-containing protein n=1 Tax=Embleya sp. NBC_00896 TaxID=2975961 RepID=UPI003868D71B|nr:CGNR zinc finger domain-containing protein [Embleya sp. NBC_00896]
MLEAPASAVLIEAFVNTVDVELGTDDLTTPAALGAWLVERELLDAGARVDAADHETGLRLRAGLREKLGVHVGDAPDPELVRRADEALRGLPLLFGLGVDGEPAGLLPSPELPPVARALAALAIAWSELVTTGEAARLKRCAEHGCAWVFWDVSKNRSRRWCSMRVCGNRTKARRYAARQTQTTKPPSTAGRA